MRFVWHRRASVQAIQMMSARMQQSEQKRNSSAIPREWLRLMIPYSKRGKQPRANKTFCTREKGAARTKRHTAPVAMHRCNNCIPRGSRVARETP